MLDVAGEVWAYNDLPPRVLPETRPKVEIEPPAPLEALRGQTPKEAEGVGGVVENSEANIPWGAGIEDQGLRWEDYREKVTPGVRRLIPKSTGFDEMDDATGEAVSDKTIYTLSISYIRNPQSIYRKMKVYINAAVNYEPIKLTDVKPANIKSKTIQLAVPEYTSPTQWRYLYAAIIYGKERGVRVVITRIKE